MYHVRLTYQIRVNARTIEQCFVTDDPADALRELDNVRSTGAMVPRSARLTVNGKPTTLQAARNMPARVRKADIVADRDYELSYIVTALRSFLDDAGYFPAVGIETDEHGYKYVRIDCPDATHLLDVALEDTDYSAIVFDGFVERIY